MPIELRILSGARAGQTDTFDKPVVSIGRHPTNDLRFDPKIDLDVSSRHGEIRFADGRYTLYDNQSTNGTFVNGERVPAGGSRQLRPGDTLTFGAQGPSLKVTIGGKGQTAPTPPAPPAPAAAPAPGGLAAAVRRTSGEVLKTMLRRPTTERVAIAVKEQTRSMRLIVIGVVGSAVVVAGGALWYGSNEAKKADALAAQAIAANDSIRHELQNRLHGDTLLVAEANHRVDSLSRVLKSARGTHEMAAATQALTDEQSRQRKISQMDLSSLQAANMPAIVLLNVEFGKEAQEATGFAVNGSGLIVTNHHVVEENGSRATKIHVKFANSRDWRAAHLVRVADNPKIDLALIQLDQASSTPSVSSLAPTMDAGVGAAIWSLGFPSGTSLPQEGTGNDAAAKPSLIVGTVSKIVSDPVPLVQLDSYATGGSSGSPVFDGRGRVIAVVWGGLERTNNRIVFSVPVERVIELIKSAK